MAPCHMYTNCTHEKTPFVKHLLFVTPFQRHFQNMFEKCETMLNMSQVTCDSVLEPDLGLF